VQDKGYQESEGQQLKYKNISDKEAVAAFI
jgi:hypothetical protein